MAIDGDKLYVADLNRLVEIDLLKERVVNAVDLKATFLNDVVVDTDGTVYVSDNMANKLYRVKDGKGEVWRQGDLGGPNGLSIMAGGLLYNAQSVGELRRMTWDAEKPQSWVKLAIGLDGIAECHGGYLVSAFDGEIWWVDTDGAPCKILDTRAMNTQSADIAYVPSLNLLLVPTFASNRLAAYSLHFK